MDFEIRQGVPGDVDRLEPLFRSLHGHHRTLEAMPPTRDADDSWRHRRAQYREWIEDGGHTLLLAERGEEAIGYAMVSVGGGAATWDLGERTAEIETLAVLEEERGSGVGRALTDAALDAAAAQGAHTVLVGVAHSNADAIRFYEREGFEPFYALMARTKKPE